MTKKKYPKGKHNAAIYLLSSKKNYLNKCLKALFDNWNSTYNYPVYVHYFGDIYDDKIFQKKIKKEINEQIIFKKVSTKIPEHIEEKKLFYNRKNIQYVRNNFSKDRIGYLHMENFCTRFLSFGEVGCLDYELKKYKYLMRIDDDSWFKNKINYDLFDILEKYPFATGYKSMTEVNQNIYDTRIGLWEFHKSYINKNRIDIKSSLLKDAFINNDEEKMHTLDWSCGNLNLYNLKAFSDSNYKLYSDLVFENGGNYKFRWGDIELIGLFAHTFFEKPLFDLQLKIKVFTITRLVDR